MLASSLKLLLLRALLLAFCSSAERPIAHRDFSTGREKSTHMATKKRKKKENQVATGRTLTFNLPRRAHPGFSLACQLERPVSLNCSAGERRAPLAALSPIELDQVQLWQTPIQLRLEHRVRFNAPIHKNNGLLWGFSLCVCVCVDVLLPSSNNSPKSVNFAKPRHCSANQ